MSIRTEITLATVLAMALLVAAFCASAQAADDYEQAKFKAEVKGKQTFVSEWHHASTDRCDTGYDSLTKETIKFKSTKPVVITAMATPGAEDPYLMAGNGGGLRLPAKATITRSHSYSSTPVPEDCGSNGGGVEPGPGPDCGTKTVRPFDLAIDYYKRGHIEIQSEDQDPDADPFERCGSGRFPFLLHGTTFGKRQDAELPEEDLFDEKIGKLITIGRGSEFIAGPENSFDETNIEWDLSLTRIKDKK